MSSISTTYQHISHRATISADSDIFWDYRWFSAFWMSLNQPRAETWRQDWSRLRRSPARRRWRWRWRSCDTLHGLIAVIAVIVAVTKEYRIWVWGWISQISGFTNWCMCLGKWWKDGWRVLLDELRSVFGHYDYYYERPGKGINCFVSLSWIMSAGGSRYCVDRSLPHRVFYRRSPKIPLGL